MLLIEKKDEEGQSHVLSAALEVILDFVISLHRTKWNCFHLLSDVMSLLKNLTRDAELYFHLPF